MSTRNTGLAASIAAALTLFGAAAGAQTTPMTSPSTGSTGASASMPMGGTPTPSATLNDTDKLFMLRSAQGDMGEIQTSSMALKKAKSGDVKATAQRLITGHSMSLKEGSGLAVLLGLPMPKDPGLMNMAFAQKLTSAGGKDFDKQYMAGQVEAHENTIALYGMELSQGQDPQVKAFAAKYLPDIESHTMQIYQVAMAVNAPDSNLRPATAPMVAGVPPSPMSGMSGTGASSMGMSGGAGSGTGASGGGMSSGTSSSGTGGSSSSGMTGGMTGTSSSGMTGGASTGGDTTGAGGAGAGGAGTGTGGAGTAGGGAGTGGAGAAGAGAGGTGTTGQ